jgi:hypothetical protein
MVVVVVVVWDDRGGVDSECGFCSAGPNILASHRGFALCFVVAVVARDVTVVAEELELLAVVLLLLLEDEVLPLDFERVLVRGSTPSLDLTFRDFDGVAGGGGEVVGVGVTVFVRSFLACLDLIFSSSSDEGLGELEPLSRAAAKEGARLSARGFAFLFGGAQIESVRLIRCTRGSSTISGRRRR